MSSSRKHPRLSKSKRRELRRRRDAKAARACQQLHTNVGLFPDALRSFPTLFAPSFTKPTLLRFSLLLVAAILTGGCSTVARLSAPSVTGPAANCRPSPEGRKVPRSSRKFGTPSTPT